MKKFRFLPLFAALVVLSTMLTGCFFMQTVETGRVGVIMEDGVSVSRVVPPGRYESWAPYAVLIEADVTNKTIEWNDPSLVTKDKQPIGMTLSVTYARKSEDDAVKGMFLRYRCEFENDDCLQRLVLSRIPEVAKSISTRFSLDQLLGIDQTITRDQVSNEVQAILAANLSEVGVELVNVMLNDIAPSATYMELLDQKAAAQVQVELAKQRSLTLAEQLNQEKAQTDIDLEIARRKNLIVAEQSKAYEASPEMLELRKLELMGQIIGANDKLIFVPAGTSLNLVMSSGNITPVQTQP